MTEIAFKWVYTVVELPLQVELQRKGDANGYFKYDRMDIYGKWSPNYHQILIYCYPTELQCKTKAPLKDDKDPDHAVALLICSHL